jgi:hypothetical protein
MNRFTWRDTALAVGFLIVLIRIWTAPLNNDEWQFAQGRGIIPSTYLAQAINSPLSTALIWLPVEPLTAIRLLSLIPSLAYFLAVRKLKVDAPGLFFLCLNPFLIELLAISKGYTFGIAGGAWAAVYWREHRSTAMLWSAFIAMLGHGTFALLFFPLALVYGWRSHWTVKVATAFWIGAVAWMWFLMRSPVPYRGANQFQPQHLAVLVTVASLVVALYLKPRWLVSVGVLILLGHVNLTYLYYANDSSDVPQFADEIKGHAPCVVLHSERIKWALWYYLATGKERFVERYMGNQIGNIGCYEVTHDGQVPIYAGTELFYLLNKADSITFEKQLAFMNPRPIKQFPRSGWNLYRLFLMTDEHAASKETK